MRKIVIMFFVLACVFALAAVGWGVGPPLPDIPGVIVAAESPPVIDPTECLNTFEKYIAQANVTAHVGGAGTVPVGLIKTYKKYSGHVSHANIIRAQCRDV